MALFKKGYEAARVEKKRQEEARENMGKRLFRFFLSGDGAEAKVRFLTEEPINFHEHTIKVSKDGKTKYNNVICNQDEGCPYCENGDRPSFKGAFLIWDYSEYERKDDKGKKQKVKGSLKIYVAGTRVLSQLDRLSNRYGLTSRDYEISRTGSGTDTSYMFERTDEVEKLTSAKITNMLPEKLRESYDGTMNSLYSILEEQLKLLLPKDNGTSKYDSDDDEDEDDDEEEYEGRSNLVDYEDMDDDEDDDELPFDTSGEKVDTTKKKKPLKLSKGKKTSIKGAFKRR